VSGLFRSIGLLLLYGLGCSAEVPSPVESNPFVAEVRFETINGRIPIGSEFTFTHDVGQFVEITLVPQSQLPDEFSGNPVRPVEEWPASIILYPPGGTHDDPLAFWLGCQRYADKKGLLNTRGVPLVPMRTGWYEAGYKQDLPRPAGLEDEGRIVAWTFLAGPPALIGDWYYEIVVFPAHIGTNMIEYELGEPIVAQRGLFHILAGEG
jgi:hypothetical protein